MKTPAIITTLIAVMLISACASRPEFAQVNKQLVYSTSVAVDADQATLFDRAGQYLATAFNADGETISVVYRSPAADHIIANGSLVLQDRLYYGNEIRVRYRIDVKTSPGEAAIRFSDFRDQTGQLMDVKWQYDTLSITSAVKGYQFRKAVEQPVEVVEW